MKKLPFLILLLGVSPGMAQKPFAAKYINHTEVGGLFGRVRYTAPYDATQELVTNKLSLTAQSFNGIQFNRRTAAGLTLGLDWYKAAFINPVAAGVRYDLTRKRNVNIIGQLDAGYGFAWFHDDETDFKTTGGLMLNPGIGIKCGKEENAAFTFTISYKRQEVEVEKPPLWDQTERHESRIYNRLALKIGISF
jgi:hypothetical protein